jgi:hypothetical protein
MVSLLMSVGTMTGEKKFPSKKRHLGGTGLGENVRTFGNYCDGRVGR